AWALLDEADKGLDVGAEADGPRQFGCRGGTQSRQILKKAEVSDARKGTDLQGASHEATPREGAGHEQTPGNGVSCEGTANANIANPPACKKGACSAISWGRSGALRATATRRAIQERIS